MMKRFILAIIFILALFQFATGVAENNYSDYSLDELIKQQEEISKEIMRRTEAPYLFIEKEISVHVPTTISVPADTHEAFIPDLIGRNFASIGFSADEPNYRMLYFGPSYDTHLVIEAVCIDGSFFDLSNTDECSKYIVIDQIPKPNTRVTFEYYFDITTSHELPQYPVAQSVSVITLYLKKIAN